MIHSCKWIFALLLVVNAVFSFSQQPVFTVEKVFFKDQQIRKVSIGEDAVWVIKGEDSSGLANVDFNEIEVDFSDNVEGVGSFNSIIGKYGSSAFLAGENGKLLKFENGKTNEINYSDGKPVSKINSIYGDPFYTFIGTEGGSFYSYDDIRFYTPYKETEVYGFAENGSFFYFSPNRPYCYGTEGVGMSLHKPGYGGYGMDLPTLEKGKYLCISQFKFDIDWYGFAGSTSGLFIGRDCNFGNKWLLKDTAVFAIESIDDVKLVGTNAGLFLWQWPHEYSLVPVNLSGKYVIYDVKYELNRNFVWLATDQGLIKLKVDFPQKIGIPFPDAAVILKTGESGQENLGALTLDNEGNPITAGSFTRTLKVGSRTLKATNSSDIFVTKQNPFGQIIWAGTIPFSTGKGTKGNEFVTAVTTDHQGNVYLSGYAETPYAFNDTVYAEVHGQKQKVNTFIAKLNSKGELVFLKPVEGLIIDLKADQEGNLFAVRETNNKTTILNKFSNIGEQLWSREIQAFQLKLYVEEDGRFYIGGNFDHSIVIETLKLETGKSNSLCIIAFTPDGKPIWGKSVSTDISIVYYREITSVDTDNSGNLYFSGMFSDEAIFDDKKVYSKEGALTFFIAKINLSGKYEWVESLKRVQGRMVVDDYGNGYVHGIFEGDSTINDTLRGISGTNNVIARFDSKGHFHWFKIWDSFGNYSKKTFAITSKVEADNKGSLWFVSDLVVNLLWGRSIISIKGESDILIARFTDSSVALKANKVSGRIYEDKNKNKIFDNGDVPLKDFIVEITPGPFYAKSDENGIFSFNLSKGKYSLRQIIPEAKGLTVTQQSPQLPYILKLDSAASDSSGFDFINNVKAIPVLSVDIAAARRRRCFPAVTNVEYCNVGSADATGVSVSVIYPQFVVPLTSSIPWVKSDSLLKFQIGTLKAGTCGTISIKDSVICGNESIRGLTQCVKAAILPKNKSIPAGDGSEIKIDLICAGSKFVRTIISNSGEGMSDSASYRVFLNAELVYDRRYKLGAGRSLNFNVPVSGKSLRVEADLTEGSEKKMISEVAEGCDIGQLTTQSKDFVNQFPQNDEEPEYEIFCLPIVDSYDPNDKSVMPSGVLDKKYISEDAELEYLIRFQNTGSDTAFKIVIKDTLDTDLDISTLSVGVASHPYSWTLSGEKSPVITWTFSNINLPDSTTNEKQSHGFVKFKIKQKPGNKGAEISNKAEIYFDFNSPVVTNIVTNTSGLPDLGGARIEVQQCDLNPVQGGKDSTAVVICDVSETAVKLKYPDSPFGVWEVRNGAGVKDYSSGKTFIRNLGTGRNEFVWRVQYCDVISENYVSAERFLSPASPGNHVFSFCEGEPVVLSAPGPEVKWYSKSDLSELISEGNTYEATSAEVNNTYFVTATQNNCESSPGTVLIKMNEIPAVPLADPLAICPGNMPEISVTGNQIKWYSDAIKSQLLYTGNNYKPENVQEGDTIYLYFTQTVNECESPVNNTWIYRKINDADNLALHNLFVKHATYQLFYLKKLDAEECLGKFESVILADASGKIVYQNTDRNFQLDTEDLLSGLYFCKISFANHIFSGSIMVLE
jgi:hypothetical protein